MKTIIYCILPAVLLSGVAACGSGNNSNAAATDKSTQPPKKTVFEPYIRDLDKAKQVQNTIQAQKRALDQQIQAQTGSTSAAPASTQSPP